MDIKIDARNSSSKIKVQHLPFNIKYDGPARLSSYFVPKKTTHLYEGKHVLQAAFRGRLLTGLPIALPAEYTGCIYRDSEQLAYKERSEHAEDAEEMPDPAESVLEWRLLGTFKELISWQRRTDNQLESDQFVDEHTTTTATVALDPNVPPAPPAPNMTTLSHKSALFNWMRWLDVGATIHAPIAQAQIARVQEQDLLTATQVKQEHESAPGSGEDARGEETPNSDVPNADIPNSDVPAPESSPRTESGTRKRKHDAVESEEGETSPANKKQRNK
jgi:hypothetical protein